MLRLSFASRGFYFCAYCAAFVRAVILSARDTARFWRAKFYELARRRGFLRFAGRGFAFARRAAAGNLLSAAPARHRPI